MIFLVLGRGKTGRVVADVASQRGHSVRVIGEEENINASALTGPMLNQFDAVIDFTTPEAVIQNMRACFANGARMASRTSWIVGTLVLLAVATAVVVRWGPWPPKETVFAHSLLANLRLMQLVAQKGDLLIDILIVELGLLVAFCGRRFNAGWRSHTQKIVLGLSTASLAQIAVRIGMQLIANAPPPQTQEQYQHLTGLQEKLYNANSVVFLLVVVWWIVCLWQDEPGTKSAEIQREISVPEAEPTEPSSAGN